MTIHQPDGAVPRSAAPQSCVAVGAPGRAIDSQLVALVHLRLAQMQGCPFLHGAEPESRSGTGAHVSLAAVAHWREATCFSARERAALALVEALDEGTCGPLSARYRTDLAAQFTEREIGELCSFIDGMNMLNHVPAVAQKCFLPVSRVTGAGMPSAPDGPAGGEGMEEPHVARVARIALRHMHSPRELAPCYPLVAELYPDIGSAAQWVERALDMKADGYRVLAACTFRRVVALAGYRVMESLRHGRFVHVDDLVTARDQRGEGIGAALLDELDAIGRDECCVRLIIDAPTSNASVHRFLKREGFDGTAVRFTKSLEKSA